MDTKQLSQISAKAVNKQDLTTGKGGGLTRGNKVFLKKKTPNMWYCEQNETIIKSMLLEKVLVLFKFAA